jgi:type II secretory pathway pseudopilin PulG
MGLSQAAEFLKNTPPNGVKSVGEKLKSGSTRKYGLTLTEFILAFLLIGVLLAALLPAIEETREQARQSATKNNLRQLGLGVSNYESAHLHFPMAVETYPEHGIAYDHIVNERVFNYSSDLFLSPHDSGSTSSKRGFGLIHYAANAKTFVSKGKPLRYDDLDSKDILVGEICDGYCEWGAPGNARAIENGINFDGLSFGSPSPSRQGACFVHVDSSVSFVSSTNERPAIGYRIHQFALTQPA